MDLHSATASETAPTEPSDDALVEQDKARWRAAVSEVRARAAGETEGVFGPRSVVWEVYRETSQVWGSMRALLLEIAHPAVAAGVDQHSTFSQRYAGRLVRTFGMPYQMLYGDLTTSLRVAATIQARHHGIRGRIANETPSPLAGVRYRANDPAYLFWVQATLLDTGLRVFETLVRPLQPRERNQFYEEHKLFATLMGIPASCVPPTLADFDAYFRAMCEGEVLQAGTTALRVWDLLRSAPEPLGSLSHVSVLVTGGMLAPRLRDAFGIAWGAREERAHALAVGVLRRMVRAMPAVARYNPVYLDAIARLAQSRGQVPDAQTRLGRFVGRLTGLAASE